MNPAEKFDGGYSISLLKSVADLTSEWTQGTYSKKLMLDNFFHKPLHYGNVFFLFNCYISSVHFLKYLSAFLF